jgi:hypothetical protein
MAFLLFRNCELNYTLANRAQSIYSIYRMINLISIKKKPPKLGRRRIILLILIAFPSEPI